MIIIATITIVPPQPKWSGQVDRTCKGSNAPSRQCERLQRLVFVSGVLRRANSYFCDMLIAMCAQLRAPDDNPRPTRSTMNRLILPLITASALIFGVFLPREEAVAQTTAKDLVGTWTLVSVTLEQDGKKTDFYGPNPQGQLINDADGHVSVIITRSDLAKFASK